MVKQIKGNKMDRRNEDLSPGTLFWVYNVVTNKGFTVYSKDQLDRLIENGTITNNYIVQKRRSAEF